MKKKQARKPMVLASALVMGMAVFAPIQAGAAEAVKKEVSETQLEQQQVKGKVLTYANYELFITGEDGKRYRVSLHDFTDEQIMHMRLKEGADIVVKGKVLDSEAFFDSFEAYKRQLPKEITNDDLAKVKNLHKELKELEKLAFTEIIGETKYVDTKSKNEEKMNRYFEVENKISEVLAPYPKAEPDFPPDKTKDINYRQTFEEFLEVTGLQIPDEDKAALKKLHEEGMAKYDKNKSNANHMDEFFEALKPYYAEARVASFEDDIKKYSVEKDDIAKLEPLYKEVVELTKKKDYDAADKKWEEIYQITEPYAVEFYKMNHFKGQQVEMNGKEQKAGTKA